MWKISADEVEAPCLGVLEGKGESGPFNLEQLLFKGRSGQLAGHHLALSLSTKHGGGLGLVWFRDGDVGNPGGQGGTA